MLVELVIAVPAVVVSYLLGVKKRRFGQPKYRCPWDLCGYPLPDSPLYTSTESHSHHPVFSAEKCPGCDKWIKWGKYEGRYVRYSL